MAIARVRARLPTIDLAGSIRLYTGKLGVTLDPAIRSVNHGGHLHSYFGQTL